MPVLDEHALDDVLHVLDARAAVGKLQTQYIHHLLRQLLRARVVLAAHRLSRLEYGVGNLARLKRFLLTAPF